jgi:hypothetical protein
MYWYLNDMLFYLHWLHKSTLSHFVRQILCDARPLFYSLEAKVVMPSVGNNLKYKDKVIWKIHLHKYKDQFMLQVRFSCLVK